MNEDFSRKERKKTLLQAEWQIEMVLISTGSLEQNNLEAVVAQLD